MPYNGAGVFTVYVPGNPVVTGTTISSTAYNNTNTDIANGLSNAITKDGTQTTTAVINFAAGLTGAHNGTVGATTPAAGTFTTLTASLGDATGAQVQIAGGYSGTGYIVKTGGANTTGIFGNGASVEAWIAASKVGSFTSTGLAVTGSLVTSTGFGCNGATAQTAFVSGGAAPAGGTGTAAGGWDTAAHRDAAITLINNMRAALVANGIMS